MSKDPPRLIPVIVKASNRSLVASIATDTVALKDLTEAALNANPVIFAAEVWLLAKLKAVSSKSPGEVILEIIVSTSALV